MADTALVRRMNEFTGVALFACALIWFIALATYRLDMGTSEFLTSLATRVG